MDVPRRNSSEVIYLLPWSVSQAQVGVFCERSFGFNSCVQCYKQNLESRLPVAVILNRGHKHHASIYFSPALFFSQTIKHFGDETVPVPPPPPLINEWMALLGDTTKPGELSNSKAERTSNQTIPLYFGIIYV